MLDAAVVLVVGGTFSGVALFEPPRFVGEGVVFKTEKTTKK